MRDSARRLILNGFGLSLGDGIIGLQALFALQSLHGGQAILRRGSGLYPLVDQLYDFVDFAEIEFGDPSTPGAWDGETIDLRDLAFDPDFAVMPMIDFFLRKLGLDPAEVPPSLKRNNWLAPCIAPAPSHADILVVPTSSTPMRDWPRALTERVLASHPRARLLRRCATLAELCHEIAGAHAIVSTDTAVLHLADAFGVPCLAVFTTHRPELRVRDYPACRAIQVPGFPEQLEFIRGPADLRQCEAAWQAWLADPGPFDEMLAAFLQEASGARDATSRR